MSGLSKAPTLGYWADNIGAKEPPLAIAVQQERTPAAVQECRAVQERRRRRWEYWPLDLKSRLFARAQARAGAQGLHDYVRNHKLMLTDIGLDHRFFRQFCLDEAWYGVQRGWTQREYLAHARNRMTYAFVNSGDKSTRTRRWNNEWTDLMPVPPDPGERVLAQDVPAVVEFDT